MVSGFVKMKDISGRRRFVQTFFLAPQEKGYFVLNDIFHFIDDGVLYPNLASVASENIEAQPHVSTSLAEPLGKLTSELCFPRYFSGLV